MTQEKLNKEYCDEDIDLGYYLGLFSAASQKSRFCILNALHNEGEISPSVLKKSLDIEDSKFHYHLDKLVDAELLRNVRRNKQDEEGYYSYYETTYLGDILTELMQQFIDQEQRVWEEHPHSHINKSTTHYPSPSTGRRSTPLDNPSVAAKVESSTSNILTKQADNSQTTSDDSS